MRAPRRVKNRRMDDFALFYPFSHPCFIVKIGLYIRNCCCDERRRGGFRFISEQKTRITAKDAMKSKAKLKNLIFTFKSEVDEGRKKCNMQIFSLLLLLLVPPK